jgi:peptidoglycan/xylan/chitin deacetylase (PgdA/CDA1 family)
MRIFKINKLAIALIFFCSFTLSAKEIAITFDDSPRFARGYLDGPTRAKLLLDNLAKHNVDETAFFCVGSQGNKTMTKEGIARLKSFSEAGHIIANHTYSHPNINELTGSEYIEEIKKAERVLQSLPTFIKWFRFPYLREGDTIEKRDLVRDYLKEEGYFNAYITVSTYDWYMEAIFQREYKKNADIDLEKVKAFFVSTTIKNIENADENALALLGRSPKHVLLLHETDLVALFIGDLVNALREKGWNIISPKAAFEDDIANFSLKTAHPWNPGRLGEIALENPDVEFKRSELLDEDNLEKRFKDMVLLL